MLILVASDATGRQAEVSPVQIFDLDGRAFLRRDVRRVVALVARQAGVLAFEQISGVFVIEGLDVPLDQREVFSVVLGVAAGAFLAGAGRNVVGGVQALAGREPGRDLGVTVQTFQRRLPAELVATGAVGRSVQGLVRPRERAGRNSAPRLLGNKARSKKSDTPSRTEVRIDVCAEHLSGAVQAVSELVFPVRSCRAPRPRVLRLALL